MTQVQKMAYVEPSPFATRFETSYREDLKEIGKIQMQLNRFDSSIRSREIHKKKNEYHVVTQESCGAIRSASWKKLFVAMGQFAGGLVLNIFVPNTNRNSTIFPTLKSKVVYTMGNSLLQTFPAVGEMLSLNNTTDDRTATARQGLLNAEIQQQGTAKQEIGQGNSDVSQLMQAMNDSVRRAASGSGG